MSPVYQTELRLLSGDRIVISALDVDGEASVLMTIVEPDVEGSRAPTAEMTPAEALVISGRLEYTFLSLRHGRDRR